MLAFKEWSTVVDALILKEQSIIVRKGGIAEDNDRFQIKADRFLLFPTLFHQADNAVKAEWLRKAPNKDYYPSANEVLITHEVKVIEERKIVSFDELQLLNDLHVYNENIISERFNRWNDKGLFVLKVEVIPLNEQKLIMVLPEMMGCKSWIDIHL